MKLLILFLTIFISINASESRSYLPTIPCIRVKHIRVTSLEGVNKFLDKIGVDNFIDVKFTESGWSLWTHSKDAYVIYKSFR